MLKLAIGVYQHQLHIFRVILVAVAVFSLISLSAGARFSIEQWDNWQNRRAAEAAALELQRQETATAVSLLSAQSTSTAAALAQEQATTEAQRESEQAKFTAETAAVVSATNTAIAGVTATVDAYRAQPPVGRVTTDGLMVRPGPGTDYEPPVGRLSQGATVSIVGRNTASDGSQWWEIASPSGWIHSDFVEESGCIDCIALADRPAKTSTPTVTRAAPTSTPTRPAPTPTSTRPAPTATQAPPTQAPVPTPPATIATNRGSLPSQGQDGWSIQYEQGRNSGAFADFSNRQSYNGLDCYMSPREDYVRVCADGDLHPGQESRVAYRWNSSYSGSVTLRVHAHKIDTRCGDGIWVGSFIGEAGREPTKLGEMAIGASDNNGQTQNLQAQLSPSTYLLVMVDIRGNAQCDQSRLSIDVNPH